MSNSQESIESRLIDVVYTALEGSVAKETITEDIPLVGGGLALDSIILLRLLNSIEEVFDIRVGDDDVTTEIFADIKTLANYLRTNS